MQPFRYDPALYRLILNGNLERIRVGYVDNLQITGYTDFRKLCGKTHKSFQMGADESLPRDLLVFAEQRLRWHHYNKPEMLLTQARKSITRSYVLRISIYVNLLDWFANTLLDHLFEISQLFQVTEERFNNKRVSIIRRMNRITMYATDNPLLLKKSVLYRVYFRVVGFSDSSFANNYEISTSWTHLISRR